jgi:hypothetical protein
MEQTMTKSKIIAGVFAALTLTTTVIATSDAAQARHRHHHRGAAAFGIGLAIGTIAAAAASNAYAEPAYECFYKKRYNRWGKRYYVKVCERY